MPNATIYIRRENEDRWKNIADKSEWVNDMLTQYPPKSEPKVIETEDWGA